MMIQIKGDKKVFKVEFSTSHNLQLSKVYDGLGDGAVAE